MPRILVSHVIFLGLIASGCAPSERAAQPGPGRTVTAAVVTSPASTEEERIVIEVSGDGRMREEVVYSQLEPSADPQGELVTIPEIIITALANAPEARRPNSFQPPSPRCVIEKSGDGRTREEIVYVDSDDPLFDKPSRPIPAQRSDISSEDSLQAK